MSEEFSGKTGLIVGGSSGIGKTVGRLLLERGATGAIWDVDAGTNGWVQLCNQPTLANLNVSARKRKS